MNADLKMILNKCDRDLLLFKNDNKEHYSQCDLSIQEDYLDEWISGESRAVSVEFTATVYAIKPKQTKCLITLKK